MQKTKFSCYKNKHLNMIIVSTNCTGQSHSLAGGTANSVARISGTLGNTLAYLSLDDEFQKVGASSLSVNYSLVKVLSIFISHK